MRLRHKSKNIKNQLFFNLCHVSNVQCRISPSTACFRTYAHLRYVAHCKVAKAVLTTYAVGSEKKGYNMQENLIKKISREKIYPIIRFKDAQRTIDTANALIEGGIKLLEINVENASIYEAIKEVSKNAIVAAGGIITAYQADMAVRSGAKIISSPIFQMNMVKITKDKAIPFIACTSTPNETYNAWKTRVPLMKIFPAKALGGVLYIEDLLRPMPFLNVMPSGNILLDEVVDYIYAGAVAVGVGRDFYHDSTLGEITKKAQKIISELKDL